MTETFFLSASIPDARRDPKFWQPEKFVRIRQSVRALASVVLRKGLLVFGGHPAITPIIRQVGERLGLIEKAVLFQSKFFEESFPEDNKYFKKYIYTDAVNSSLDSEERRRKSLERMRLQMIATGQYANERREILSTEEYDAAIFIGGMEGVVEELDLFRKYHPNKPIYPVVSTGVAAAGLEREVLNLLGDQQVEMLQKDLAYGPMFETLLFKIH